MKKRAKPLNPKRRLIGPEQFEAERAGLGQLADRIRYGGHPAHKRNPGDFGLKPPSGPRQGKTLCDGVEIFSRASAEGLLKAGMRRGLVSVQRRNEWPQNIWAVSENGSPLEAQLDNQESGQYHGYPIQFGDPLWLLILERWRAYDAN